MKADRAEVLRQEWRERLSRVLGSMLEGTGQEQLRREDVAQERKEAEVFSGQPSKDLRLDPVKRHNFAARRLKG